MTSARRAWASADDAPESTTNPTTSARRKKSAMACPLPQSPIRPTKVLSHFVAVLRLKSCRKQAPSGLFLRRHARPRRYLAMPAAKVGKRLRHSKLGRLHEVDRDHGRDVGDREARARDVGASFELAVEKPQKILHARLVGFAPGGHLRHLHRRHRGMKVTEDLGDAGEQMEFDAPLPHLDQRLLARVL